jgi:hypothetical protein
VVPDAADAVALAVAAAVGAAARDRSTAGASTVITAPSATNIKSALARSCHRRLGAGSSEGLEDACWDALTVPPQARCYHPNRYVAINPRSC